MLKFFRRIRQQLLLENQTSKYLLYAVGEILLVMIGILLALQVNNWNENRKNENRENQALVDLKIEFKKNIEKLLFFKDIKLGQETQFRNYYELLTNDAIPITDKVNSAILYTHTAAWAPSNSVINSLLSTGQIENISNDSLKYLLTNWPSKVSEFQETEKELIHRILNFLNYQYDNVPAPIAKKGDYMSNVETYYPNDLKKKWETAMVELVKDIKYQNFMARITNYLYIQQIQINQMMEEYSLILKLLDSELDSRNIEIEASK